MDYWVVYQISTFSGFFFTSDMLNEAQKMKCLSLKLLSSIFD